MARIDAEDLEALKRQTDLVALVQAAGVSLSGGGDNLRGLCPFHQETEPSFSVSVSKQLWNCLGACQEGGDVIKFVMRHKRVAFRHALELIKHGATEAPGGGRTPVLPCPVSPDATDAAVMDQVLRYYQQRLKECPEAQAYLQRRGITNAEVVESLRIGYADRTLGLRLPPGERKDGAELRGRLETLGIYRGSGHEHMAGSLVVPIIDVNGAVLGMYGRKIGARLRVGTPLHLYLPGPHRGVFNEARLRGQETVVLCEALLDAISFMQCGVMNTTSSYGVGGFTEEIFSALKTAGVKRVLIAYDADDAGNSAAQKLAVKLYDAGMLPFRVVFPPERDANKCLQEGMDLRTLVDRAQEMEVGAHRVSPAPSAQPQPAALLSPAPTEPAAQDNAATQPAAEENPPDPAPRPLPKLTEQLFSAASGLTLEEISDDLFFSTGNRKYRVRGLRQNHTKLCMKVCIKAMRTDVADHVHVDSMDFISNKLRAGFAREAAFELEVAEEIIKRDVAKLYDQLELILDAWVKSLSEPKDKEVILTPEEQLAALEFLKIPNILERISRDARSCGIVGEEANILVGYLAAISRFLPRPLGVAIQSSSAAGKTSLMDAVLAFVPDEHKKKFSALTGQVLFYMTNKELQHKVLAVVEEQGAERTSYALKLLLSEGRLSIASTAKNPQTGNMEAKQYLVEGPVALFYTTTSPNPDEELMNRCIVFTVNESREQTRRIHRLQRERRTLQGILDAEQQTKTLKLHQDAQRMLKRIAVVNELREHAEFRSDKIRMRRDNEKYLALLDALALLRQHQKKHEILEQDGVRVEYIRVDDVDIALGNALADQVLAPSMDELLPQDRKLLQALTLMVAQMCQEQHLEQDLLRFTRRQAREFIGWTEKQLRVHLDRLVDHEYVGVHRGKQGQSFVYELMYEIPAALPGGTTTHFDPPRPPGDRPSTGTGASLSQRPDAETATSTSKTGNGKNGKSHSAVVKLHTTPIKQ